MLLRIVFSKGIEHIQHRQGNGDNFFSGNKRGGPPYAVRPCVCGGQMLVYLTTFLTLPSAVFTKYMPEGSASRLSAATTMPLRL